MRNVPLQTALFLCLPLSAVAQTAYVAPELLTADPTQTVRVIVQYAPGTTARPDFSREGRGYHLHRHFTHVQADSYNVPANSIGALANAPNVVAVVPD